jgi:hypothetical protein
MALYYTASADLCAEWARGIARHDSSMAGLAKKHAKWEAKFLTKFCRERGTKRPIKAKHILRFAQDESFIG